MIPTHGSVFDPARFLAGKDNGTARLTYRQGDTIFAPGDHADSVFYIHAGNVKKSCVSRDGKERVIAVLGGGDFFGTGCVVGRTERGSTAIAMTACSATRIETTVMLSVLYSEPALAEMFISFLIASRAHYKEDLVDYLFNPSEKRLARTLLLLCDVGEDDGEDVVLPKMSQETLGQLVGTTRSRINYFMNKFRRCGFVEYSDKIRVKRLPLNKFVHEYVED
jgi:CRP-like cAMP-binding protein